MPETERAYAFRENVPLNPIRRGSTLLVAGPTHDGARNLCLLLSAGGPNEGTVIVTTNAGASRVVADFQELGAQFDPKRAGIVDCVSDSTEESFPARVLTVSSPRDLTGIGIRFSELYNDLHDEGIEQVRSSLISVSTLLSLGDAKQVTRFIHTLTGRIESVGGIGFFLVDPTTQEERTIRTISQFCDGRIDVRDQGDGPELRPRGLPDQPREWQSFEPPL